MQEPFLKVLFCLCLKEGEILAELKEIRCKKCKKLLAKGKGTFEIKCPRCGTLNKSEN